jgi:hypothetical protein
VLFAVLVPEENAFFDLRSALAVGLRAENFVWKQVWVTVECLITVWVIGAVTSQFLLLIEQF